MTLITRAVLRALSLAAFTATALFAAIAPASAHVEVHADNAVRGGETILTFEVPNESDKGALTTQLSVALPDVASADTEPMPGWARQARPRHRLRHHPVGHLDRRTRRWIAPDQFALFRVAVTLPNADSVSFPVAQTYPDGTVVRWDRHRCPAAPNPIPCPDAGPDRRALRQRPAECLALCLCQPVPHQHRHRPHRHPTTPHAGWPAPLWSSARSGLALSLLLMRRRS